jgi:hypothetical protein
MTPGRLRMRPGSTAEGIAWIEDGIRDYQATGAMLRMPYFLALKAEAFYLAARPAKALEAIREAEAKMNNPTDNRRCSADKSG